MHLDMTTFKSTNIHLNQTSTYQSNSEGYESSGKSLLCLHEGYLSTAQSTFNAVVQNEDENRELFGFENENFLKHHFEKKEPEPVRIEHGSLKAENEEEPLEKSKLENFQDVFFVPPPFQPFSSPPSSVLSSLPALSPDDDIPGLNGILANHECDFDSHLVDLTYDVNTLHGGDYWTDEKVRNGHILMPIHNPPVVPNVSVDCSNQEKCQQFTLPEGFNTNVLHIPEHQGQVDDLHSLLTQIEEANGCVFDAQDRHPPLPKFNKSMFTNYQRPNLTAINFQDQPQPVQQKTDEFIPILNFKTEYSESDSFGRKPNRIFESEVKQVQRCEGQIDGLLVANGEPYETCENKLGHNEPENLYDTQDVKKRAARRGRRKGSSSEQCEGYVSYQNLELYENGDGCQLDGVTGRGYRRGPKGTVLGSNVFGCYDIGKMACTSQENPLPQQKTDEPLLSSPLHVSEPRTKFSPRFRNPALTSAQPGGRAGKRVKRNRTTSLIVGETDLNCLIRNSSTSLERGLCHSFNENGCYGHLSARTSSSRNSFIQVKDLEGGDAGDMKNLENSSQDTELTGNHLIVQQGDRYSDDASRAKVQMDGDMSEEDDVSEGMRMLKCKWMDCEGIFPSQVTLVKHIEKCHVEHRRGEEFACFWEDCSRRSRPFNARYKLLIHMRVHSGEKPNKCPFEGCSKAFSRLENLKIHQRSHTGERPYTCQYEGCTKAFSNSSDRAKHQRTHFDTKPYACQVVGCTKRYTDPSSLRKHIKNHSAKEQQQARRKSRTGQEEKKMPEIILKMEMEKYNNQIQVSESNHLPRFGYESENFDYDLGAPFAFLDPALETHFELDTDLTNQLFSLNDFNQNDGNFFPFAS